MKPKRRGLGGRGEPLYVSKALFEAVFGPWNRSEGNTSHSHVHGDPEPSYEGFDRRGGKYYAPVNRKRKER